MNQLTTNMTNSIGPRKYYICSQCEEKKASVIEVEDKLVCVECRYDEIGLDALKEPLFWDL